MNRTREILLRVISVIIEHNLNTLARLGTYLQILFDCSICNFKSKNNLPYVCLFLQLRENKLASHMFTTSFLHQGEKSLIQILNSLTKSQI